MFKITYNEKTTKEELQKFNIVIIDSAKIANGVKLGANVFVGGNAKIEEDVEVGANTVIEDSEIKQGVKILSSFIKNSVINKNTTVGPFAHIRDNANIGEGCRIGNFVEIKKSKLGDGCKVAHLTYIGDAELGANCNVGCGVVFCNYNGKIKQKTIVGNNVFIGSNVNLVAPIKVADCAYIAAGSTINRDVGLKDFSIARARQENKKGFKNPYTS